MELSGTRREFLKSVMTATVIASVLPAKSGSQIVPELKKSGDKLLGIYTVKISEHPELADYWKSIKIKIDGIVGYFPKIIVMKVTKADYGVDYYCFLDQCPHQGNPIKDFNEETYTFTCTGHGTLFGADGVYIWGPASRDLYKLDLTYDGGDDINIEVPALVPPEDVADEKPLSYAAECFPNPCSVKTSIRIGLEQATKINARIFDASGTTMLTLPEQYFDSGIQTMDFSVGSFPPGIYFAEIITDYSKFIKRFVVSR